MYGMGSKGQTQTMPDIFMITFDAFYYDLGDKPCEPPLISMTNC